MELKKLFIDNIHLLNTNHREYTWELISQNHSKVIVDWRNSVENLQYFENQKRITLEEQELFLKQYCEFERVDLVLALKNKPIGVFNVKNLGSMPEYGALIGEKSFRGKGIGAWAKKEILNLWFNVLNQSSIYLRNRLDNEKVIDSNRNSGYEVVLKDEFFVIFKVTKEQYNRT